MRTGPDEAGGARIGLIGVGRIGAAHARTLAADRGVAELLVADADADRARAVAGPLAATVTGVEELFEAPLDGLAIAAPTDAHAELVHRALDAGLPVFCEKPLARDLDGTLAIAEHAERVDVAVQVGFMRRFDAGFRALREAVASGRLGPLRLIRAVTADAVSPPASYIATSGGIFRDCHVHDFDAVRFVTGREIASVYATGASREGRFEDAGDVESSAAVVLLDDGTVVSVTGTRSNGGGYDVRMEVCGSEGALCAGLDAHAPLRSAEPGEAWPPGPPHVAFYERFRAAYEEELHAFVQLVQRGGESACPPRDALEALRAAEAAERSRAEGRAVALAEVGPALL